MRFVHNHQCVGGQVLKQRGRRITRIPARQITGVVFNALTVAQLANHLEVIQCTLLQTLCLDQLFVFLQLHKPALELFFNMIHSAKHHISRGDVMRFWKNRYARHLGFNSAGEWIENTNILDFFVKQFDPHRFSFRVRGEDINDVAPDTIGATLEIYIVTGVLELSQLTEHPALINDFTAGQVHDHLEIGLRIAQTIDCRHSCNYQAILSLQQRLGGRQTHLLNVLINRCILFYKRIGRWNIRLRLVIIVIGNEVLDGVIGKELLELSVKLGRQGFVVRHYDRWPLQLFDHVGHRKGFTGAGDP